MPEDVKPSSPTADSQLYKLRIRRDSWLMPLMFLLAAIAIFALYALPSGERQLIDNAYALVGPAKVMPEELSAAKLPNPTSGQSLQAVFKIREPLIKKLEADWKTEWWKALTSLGLPLAKVYFTKLVEDAGRIIVGFAKIGATFVACALIPGVAGLVYRRRFWAWFIASLLVLIALNSSGVMGKLMVGQTVPASGELLLFVVTQVALIIFGLRLRRHSTGGGWLPTWLHNWALAIGLILVGLACLKGWGSQYNLWWFLEGHGALDFVYKAEFVFIVLPLLHLLLRDSPVWPARRGKNIVICLDGTTNTPDQMERGFGAQTNIFKLFKMLRSNTEGGFLPASHFDASLFKKYGDRQIAFYYAGVGNTYDNNPIMQFLGGATGFGARDIIERAYLDLIRVYRPHDRVYIVGFSRGAAIARLLARTIDARKAPRWIYSVRLLGRQRVLAKSRHVEPVQIDVLGCFDTVGSFGIAKTIGGINFQQIDMGLDLTVPDNVERAYHLVALDERRDSFEPTLMEPDPIYPESIVEVWFAGDHANIGGGWATDNLSDITMDFLLRHISSGYFTHESASTPRVSRKVGDESWGIYLDAERKKKKATGEDGVDDPRAVDPQASGPVRHWFSNVYKYRSRVLPNHAVIHDTVFERIMKASPVYAPEALFKLQDGLDALRATIDKEQAKLLTSEEAKKNASSGGTLKLWRWSEYERQQLREYKPDQWLDNAVLEARDDAASKLEILVYSLKKPRAAPAG